MNNPDNWQILDSVTLFKNAHIELLQEQVIPPGETQARNWTIARRKKAVVVSPVTAEGKYILVRQARIPIRKVLWEFPAGQVDASMNPDMVALHKTAWRELAEETGYQLAAEGDLTFLGHYYSSQGFTDETSYLFLARPVRPSGRSATPDNSESIMECGEFTFEELRKMIADCVIQDANTLALFARLTAKKLIP